MGAVWGRQRRPHEEHEHEPPRKRRRVASREEDDEYETASVTASEAEGPERNKQRQRRRRWWIVSQFNRAIDDALFESLLERDLRGMPMLAVEGRLVTREAPASRSIVLDHRAARRQLPQAHVVLAVTSGSSHSVRGVCGLGVAAARTQGSTQAARMTWVFVAKRAPVDLPGQLWCSAICATRRTRVVPESVKGLIFGAFHIPSRGVTLARIMCPITYVAITDEVDAVMAPDGHVYVRQAIVEWLCRSGTSPITFQPMLETDLVPFHPS
eukprot:m51a1_g10525 hypothetical protein (269) ;mRNA; f:227359-229332